ncbi:MAG: arylamine N-acetyltransferase, partial [Bdellovibrionota bacterium]
MSEMQDEARYLKLLGVQKSRPSLSFLTEIVKRQLEVVPYENVSKVIRFHEMGPSIPTFSELVAGIAERNYGGTCFAQNIHLHHLLGSLGFDSTLVGIRREGFLSHVSLRVLLEGYPYLVDVGIMSSIAGPYRIHPESAFDLQVGNQRYVFSPSADQGNYSLDIHRDGQMIRSFQSSSEPVTDAELEVGIRKTFEPSALFMNTLCIHRVFERHSVGIWNKQIYRIQGTERIKREVQTVSELEAALRVELGLPDYPL